MVRFGFIRLVGSNIAWYTRNLPKQFFRERSEFDRKHCADTEEIREIGSLGIESDNVMYAVRYQPSPGDLAETLLNGLEIDYSKFTFLDYGAGKGKVLLIAGMKPFKAVIGVEFSEELQQIATKNIEAQMDKSFSAETGSMCTSGCNSIRAAR